MKVHRHVVEGVVAECNGEYWGKQYEDGYCTEYDFGPILNATLSDPEFCHKPTDLTYKDSHEIPQLEQAKLVPIRKTIIWELL